MAWVSPKVIKILDSLGEKSLIEKIPNMSQEEAESAIDEAFGKSGKENVKTTNGDRKFGKKTDKNTFIDDEDGTEKPLNDRGELVDEEFDGDEPDYDFEDEKFEQGETEAKIKNLGTNEFDEKDSDNKNKGFTEEGKKLAAEARNSGLSQFYDPFTGNFGLTKQDLDKNTDKVNAWIKAHPEYSIVSEPVMEGSDLEHSSDGKAYYLTSDLEDKSQSIKLDNKEEDPIAKHNRMVGLESQMHSKIDNARKNGQSPQQVLDTVSYDMDIQPGTEEFDRLKTLVMYDTRMNKDSGQYEYNKYNIVSNKQVSGDERKKLQELSDAFNKAGLENKLEDTWEDYGARMGMTNLIHNNVQVLNPKEWMDYMNGNASAEEIIDRVKNSEYKNAFKWKEPQEESDNEDEHNNLSNMLKEYGVEIKPTPTHQSKYEIKSNKLPFAKREEITKKLESLGYEVQGDGNGNLNIWNSLNENQYNNKRNDWIIDDFLGQYGYKENLSPEERAVIAKILRLK